MSKAGSSRVVYEPRPVEVRVREDGRPLAVATDARGGSRLVAVEAVREEWLVEDRWWTPRPLGRHYFELALVDGRCLVVFREAGGGRWFSQRA